MSYKLFATSDFERELKFLSRKYRSLKTDLQPLFDSLRTNPTQGTPLGNNAYKIRLAIASKGKGKSGGGRVITYVFVHNELVLLLALYDKSETATIADAEIRRRIEGYLKNV